MNPRGMDKKQQQNIFLVKSVLRIEFYKNRKKYFVKKKGDFDGIFEGTAQANTFNCSPNS